MKLKYIYLYSILFDITLSKIERIRLIEEKFTFRGILISRA